ncbi:hypothetical protein BATDEDRAFT_21829 [Batrachochytrium dendrobatidis JAM81]|uniref:Uncharacterized protein n=2 Tax=Batrachochytrium dendrobatidis TaxID=109871 RepID=F4NVI5_BATDJ|nr:uncharacterized protein BATDEDRAFT_21829 [Batrachochytrium dendrobatidis JAM81]EGF83274.1 hypothetical protein BATDEDRAFT_21829 [Batrachochytrium dendrobatidis JAM81]OAJ36606.1 hypothetical protein BDEG_20764 [Batrachochytrium dendrobatidis JEL423]|eukprot:XP_006675392.1 hypothetical protein BATDEDRAFT_21829 [Batrachochytrium dendrobatidis JAM81]
MKFTIFALVSIVAATANAIAIPAQYSREMREHALYIRAHIPDSEIMALISKRDNSPADTVDQDGDADSDTDSKDAGTDSDNDSKDNATETLTDASDLAPFDVTKYTFTDDNVPGETQPVDAPADDLHN